MSLVVPHGIQMALNWQAQHIGALVYSESDGRRLDCATAAELLEPTDCSGNVHRMCKFFMGIDVGTYTGNQCLHGELVTLSKSAAADGVGMLPGDRVLYDWDGGNWDHTNMYAGGDLVYNHGGPGRGPVKQSLRSNVEAAVKIMVRRDIHQIIAPIPPPPHPAGNPMHGHVAPALIGRGTGDYYGLISGPNESHGGAYSAERPAIELIQRFLNWYQKAGLKVDGIFGASTATAVSKFQHASLPGTTSFGQVWYDDWAAMASKKAPR